MRIVRDTLFLGLGFHIATLIFTDYKALAGIAILLGLIGVMALFIGEGA